LTTSNRALLWGAILAFLAILFGAFGSHALAELLSQGDRQRIFDIANRYHFYNAFSLLIYGLLWKSGQLFRWQKHCSWLMLLGTILFSGSLYLLATTGVKGVGILTPVGGVMLLVAWGLLIADLLTQETGS